jgi:hypothetical protein
VGIEWLLISLSPTGVGPKDRLITPQLVHPNNRLLSMGINETSYSTLHVRGLVSLINPSLNQPVNHCGRMGINTYTSCAGWVEGLINPGVVGQVISTSTWGSDCEHVLTLPILINPRQTNPLIKGTAWESYGQHALHVMCGG